MENKELLAKEIIGMACEETISYSLSTVAPIEDITYSSHLSLEEPIIVYILFESVEMLMNMEENHLENAFMDVFKKAMAREKYPFGKTPQIEFEFSIAF